MSQFDPALLLFQHHAQGAAKERLVVALFAARTAEVQRVRVRPTTERTVGQRLTESPRHQHGLGGRQDAVDRLVVVREEGLQHVAGLAVATASSPRIEVARLDGASDVEDVARTLEGQHEQRADQLGRERVPEFGLAAFGRSARQVARDAKRVTKRRDALERVPRQAVARVPARGPAPHRAWRASPWSW